MPLETPPALDVLALVLTSWTAGTAVLAAATRIGGQVDPGHFKVVWLVVAGLAVALGFGHPLAWGVAVLSVLTFAAIYRRWDLAAGTVTAVAAFATLLVSVEPVAFALAAGLLLGAVTNAMLLGHWHLNQPRLGTGPLLRLVWALWAGLGAFGAASILLLLRALDERADAALVGAMTALAFVLFTAVLAAMVTHLVRHRSIMSATGILYLAILLCFVAVFTGSLGALARGPT